MAFPVQPPISPMLAKLHDAIPTGEGWRYEPKWDGFRAIVFRDGDEVAIASRNGQPLARYFPDVVELARRCLPLRVVVDTEIVIAGARGLDFDALQLRLHPAASRVRMLAERSPATLVLFDLLGVDDEDLRAAPFDERRRRLAAAVGVGERCFVTPQTRDAEEAGLWFERFEGAGLDGVIAKRGDLRYVPGERVMVKVKHQRTADCVVGGYRLDRTGKTLGSLLLGLYDEASTMHFVGFTSSFKAAQRREILEMLQPLRRETGFEGGRAPGSPSRWSSGRDSSWFPVEPRLVCEVAFDHLQGDRFRHGTTFLRWRPDKDARECTYAQLEAPRPVSLDEIRALAARSD